MANNKDNGNDFGDEEFDVDDFSDDLNDADLDEAALAELEQESDSFGDEDFDEGAWDDGTDTPATDGKKDKKKSKGVNVDRPKKGFLNFNNIMIIGGVIVGGIIMVTTIGGKSATQEGSNTGMFKSVMNISGMMDGTIFGDSKKDAKNGEPATGEKEDEGFLNDPENALPEIENPPQPNPIAPTDTAEMDEEDLTPMPLMPSMSDGDEGTAEMPRGPEDAPSAPPVIGSAPATSANSAEEVLKRVMAERAQKANEEKAEAQNKPDLLPVPAIEASPEPVEETELAQEPELIEPEPQEDVREPEPAPVATAAPVAVEKPPASTVSEAPSIPTPAEAQLVGKLEEKIDTLLERMEKIESELGNVRNTSSEDYGQVAETVATLREEIDGLKKTAPSADTVKSPVEKAPAEKKSAVPTSAPKKAAKSPVANKQAAKPKPVASGRWELRAAQPGRAWISRSGERDMQSVEVGQTLPNLGRVTAISYQNGRWTVLATQGRIDQ